MHKPNAHGQALSPTHNYLPPGTVVNEYMIEKALAGGGFSSVYLARQLSDQCQVVIKEYLPRKLAHRHSNGFEVTPINAACETTFKKGKKLFMTEARILASLKHPNIVEVINYFKENSTIYMVMTYDYGKGLEQYIVPDKKAHFSFDFLMRLIRPLLEGLELVHDRGLLHLDVKPQNILLKPNGYPLLLDFGAAHPYLDTEYSPGTAVHTRGYSAIEQYTHGSPLGPWTDIYATGATIRTCLDGMPPPIAERRITQDCLQPANRLYSRYYPKQLLTVIDACIEPSPQNRPQSIREVLDLLPH